MKFDLLSKEEKIIIEKCRQENLDFLRKVYPNESQEQLDKWEDELENRLLEYESKK